MHLAIGFLSITSISFLLPFSTTLTFISPPPTPRWNIPRPDPSQTGPLGTFHPQCLRHYLHQNQECGRRTQRLLELLAWLEASSCTCVGNSARRWARSHGVPWCLHQAQKCACSARAPAVKPSVYASSMRLDMLLASASASALVVVCLPETLISFLLSDRITAQAFPVALLAWVCFPKYRPRPRAKLAHAPAVPHTLCLLPTQTHARTCGT